MPPLQALHIPGEADAPGLVPDYLQRRGTNISLASLASAGTEMDYVADSVETDTMEERSSDLGLMWNEIMEKGNYTASSTYTNVQVLLLSYAEGDDDLHVKEEIDALKEVFQGTYKFKVEHKKIKARSRKRPQIQVNAYVSHWVFQHDGPSTLLIVYFAGHGSPSNNGGELWLSGKKASPNQIEEAFNDVIWNNTEKNLHNLESDVLQIFDCCYAGSMPYYCDGNKAIEFLAACGRDQLAPRPGPNSFTSALIRALKGYAERGTRFTTANLLSKIKQDSCFDKARGPSLTPMTRSLDKRRQQRIILHPLRPQDERAHDEAATDAAHERQPAIEQYELDLKFVFNSMPEKHNIADLGNALNDIVRQKSLPMSKIKWGGISPKDDAVLKAHSRFRDLVNRARAQAIHEAGHQVLGKRSLPHSLDENLSSRRLSRRITEMPARDDSLSNIWKETPLELESQIEQRESGAGTGGEHLLGSQPMVTEPTSLP